MTPVWVATSGIGAVALLSALTVGLAALVRSRSS
jgi:membrane-anchored mycosin MYCP